MYLGDLGLTRAQFAQQYQAPRNYTDTSLPTTPPPPARAFTAQANDPGNAIQAAALNVPFAVFLRRPIAGTNWQNDNTGIVAYWVTLGSPAAAGDYVFMPLISPESSGGYGTPVPSAMVEAGGVEVQLSDDVSLAPKSYTDTSAPTGILNATKGWILRASGGNVVTPSGKTFPASMLRALTRYVPGPHGGQDLRAILPLLIIIALPFAVIALVAAGAIVPAAGSAASASGGVVATGAGTAASAIAPGAIAVSSGAPVVASAAPAAFAPSAAVTTASAGTAFAPVAAAAAPAAAVAPTSAGILGTGITVQQAAAALGAIKTAMSLAQQHKAAAKNLAAQGDMTGANANALLAADYQAQAQQLADQAGISIPGLGQVPLWVLIVAGGIVFLAFNRKRART